MASFRKNKTYSKYAVVNRKGFFFFIKKAYYIRI